MDEMLVIWTAVNASATIAMVVVLFRTLRGTFAQVRAMRQAQELQGRAHELQGFVKVADWLQREEVRRARGRVYELEDIKYKRWARADREEARVVCYNFDVVGDMLDRKLIDEGVLDKWGWTISRCWVTVEPMVKEEREKNPRLFDQFERLAEVVYKEYTNKLR
ncbi:MAG: hypothetical protein A2Z77_02120 [Chloroflexi bacterium RBG_13_51_36]|nr:MAG: hypothetical protein A2Z77_02120 [Chloroflexi bacterium RBG_13_51_36]